MADVPTPTPTPAPAPAPTPAPTPTPAPSPAPSPDAPKPPAGLDAKFWNQTEGKVLVDELVKSYGELNQFKTAADAKLAEVPAKPEDYKLDLVPEFKPPEGFEVKFDLKDPVRGPVLQKALAYAHAAGLPQAVVSNLLTLQAETDLAIAAAADHQLTQQIVEEEKKLGPNFPARGKALTDFLTAHLKPERAQALMSSATRALAFEAIEELMQKVLTTGVPGNRSDTTPPAQEKSIADRIWPTGFGSPQAKVS